MSVIRYFSKSFKTYRNNSFDDVVYYGDIWQKDLKTGYEYIMAHRVSEPNAKMILKALEGDKQ